MNQIKNILRRIKAWLTATPSRVELLKFGSSYFFLSLINLRAKLAVTPIWFGGRLENNHDLLLAFQYTNNEQSRLFQYYIPEFLHSVLGISIPNAYILQRWVFVFLAFICFHIYLRKWFDSSVTFAGVAFLAAIMPLSYQNHLQESASLLLLTFVLALWAIREHKTIWYTLVLFIGALNNETILVLPMVYFCYNFREWKFNHLLRLSLMTFGTCLPAFLAAGMIRYITRDRPHLGGAWHLPDNLEGIAQNLRFSPLEYYKAEYLYIIFIFGIFWLFAFFNYSQKTIFLKRAWPVIPIFILIHFLTGITNEVRQMLPLSFIIIPMALFYLFPQNTNSNNES